MGEKEKEITITYETLYELLRRENNREDIQKLDNDFIKSVKKYLNEKRSMLYKTNNQQMLFSEEEQKKTLQQITNIIKILRELYDRREKKIITLALNMSRTNSKSIDTSNLLEQEKGMYQKLVEILSIHRTDILCNMVDGSKVKEMMSCNIEKEETEEPQQEVEEEPAKDIIKVKFLTEVQKFIDPNLKVHGPFESDDTAELPVSIADVLIKNGKVEVI